MVINLVAVKLALGFGSLAAAYLVYNRIPENRYRSKLRKVFQTGELKVEKSSIAIALTSKDDIKRKIYPTIHAVYEKGDKWILVFSIPFGLDPAEVMKKKWLFEQQFGDNIELERENKKFVLTIPTKEVPKIIKFDYIKFLPYIENMKLPIVVGYNDQKFEAYDMVPDPNLIISGEPGSGKSTQLRAILTTLILHLPSTKLEMYLGDLKRSEFHLFKRVKHVKAVANDAKEI